MKTILILTDNLPNQINGVVTTYRNIVTEAELDGYTVHCITPLNFRHIDAPGYPEIKLSLPIGMGSLINNISPDFIHIATEGPIGLYARNYLSFHGIRHNTAYHTKFPEAAKKIIGIPEWLTWLYIKWFHKHSGKVLTTTNSMVRTLKAAGLDTEIISWTRGVNREVFNSSYRTKHDQIVLLCVGRVSLEKNLESFFEIKYPNSIKIMVGDGPQLDIYKKKYTDVQFVGSKQGKELAEYFANADVFVFPSRWDTFGIVMIEAMACGTPVAAYPCQGPLDVIDHGVTGYINTTLVGAIESCLTLSRNVVETTSKKWTWRHAWEIFRDNLVSVNKRDNKL